VSVFRSLERHLARGVDRPLLVAPEAIAASESSTALTSEIICEPRSMKNITTSMISLQARTKADAGLSRLSSHVMPPMMTSLPSAIAFVCSSSSSTRTRPAPDAD